MKRSEDRSAAGMTTDSSREAWSSPAQVADLFQVSRATVHSKIHSGVWPHHRLGKRIARFSEADIDAIKQISHRQPAAQPLQEQVAALELNIAAMSIMGATSRSLKAKKSKLLSLRLRLADEVASPNALWRHEQR